MTVGDSANESEQIPGGIRVGTNLMTPGGGYNIGRLQQFGTGPIKPTNGKLLRFVVNGQQIFSRGTKGIPARPFLFWSPEDARKVAAIFASYMTKGV